MHYFGSGEQWKGNKPIRRWNDWVGIDLQLMRGTQDHRNFASLRKPLTIVVSADYQLVLAIVAFEILLQSDFSAPPAYFEQLSVSFVQLVAYFAIFSLVHVNGVYLNVDINLCEFSAKTNIIALMDFN